MRNSSNNSIINRIGLYCLCVGIYFFLYNIRWQFFLSVINTERTYLWAINIIALIGALITLVYSYSIKEQLNHKLLFSIEWLPFLSVIPIFISSINAGIGIGEIIVEISILVFPLVLLLPTLNSHVLSKSMPIVLLILNILLIIIVIGALVDKTMDRAAIKWLASFMTCDRFKEFAIPHNKETRRYFSIIGHPLVTSAFANTVYTINHFARKNRIICSLPDFIEMILVGVIMVATEGRAGLVIYALLSFLIFFRRGYMLVSTIIVMSATYLVGAFDNIISRFNASTIDSNRFNHIVKLLNDDNYSLRFLSGYGKLTVSDGTIYNRYHSAFEQPLVVFAFRYGILTAILLIVVPCILVSYKLIKRKQYTMLIMWILLFAQENVMPWLAYGYDEPLRFYYSTQLLLSLSVFIPPEIKDNKLS